MNPETKIKAAEAITEKGTEFHIPYKGEVYTFSMSGLKLQTLIDISAEQEKLTLHNQKASPVEVIAAMKTDAEIQAKIIALAVINSKDIPQRPEPEQTVWQKIGIAKKSIPVEEYDPAYMTLDQLTKFFLKTIDSKHLNTLSNLVKEKTGYTAFFLSTVSLRGINLLEKTETVDTGQPAQSGEE
jgi:hypothetical protein